MKKAISILIPVVASLLWMITEDIDQNPLVGSVWAAFILITLFSLILSKDQKFIVPSNISSYLGLGELSIPYHFFIGLATLVGVGSFHKYVSLNTKALIVEIVNKEDCFANIKPTDVLIYIDDKQVPKEEIKILGNQFHLPIYNKYVLQNLNIKISYSQDHCSYRSSSTHKIGWLDFHKTKIEMRLDYDCSLAFLSIKKKLKKIKRRLSVLSKNNDCLIIEKQIDELYDTLLINMSFRTLKKCNAKVDTVKNELSSYVLELEKKCSK